jgi:hypothetical protein
MYPVFLNSRESGSFQDLYTNLIEICKSHKKDDRALAFAFILYDFTNEAIREALQQETKWDALHTLSGKYLTVFSIHSKPIRRVRAKSNKPGDGYIHMLTSISSYDTPEESEQLLIDKYFDKEVSFPSLLFFQVDDDKVIESILIELKEKGAQDTYYEIKEYIAAAVKALKKIEPNSRNNHKEIFRQVMGNVEQVKAYKDAKRVGTKVIPLVRFIGLISKLA